jgi:hypothetical protein
LLLGHYDDNQYKDRTTFLHELHSSVSSKDGGGRSPSYFMSSNCCSISEEHRYCSLTNSLSHRRHIDINLVGNISFELESLCDTQLSRAGVGRKI